MFNGYNSLSTPSINGLQSIKADDITTVTLTSDNITLSNLEVNDILIDTDLTMQSGANIVANEASISDVELSYLDGVSSNIQNQIDTNTSNITNNTSNISTNTSNITTNASDIDDLEQKTDDLEQKTTDMTYTSDITRFSSSLNVKDSFLGTSFGTTINNDSVIMKYFTTDKHILELTNLITTHNAPVLKVRGKYNILCEWGNQPFFEIKLGDVYLYDNAKLIFTDLSEQTTAFTDALKTKITNNNINITTNSNNITTNSNNITTLQDKTSYLSKSIGLSTFSSDVLCNNIHLNNNLNLNGLTSKIIFFNGSEQTTAFSDPLKTTYDAYNDSIQTLEDKTSDLNYDSGAQSTVHGYNLFVWGTTTFIGNSEVHGNLTCENNIILNTVNKELKLTGGGTKIVLSGASSRIELNHANSEIEFPDATIQSTAFTDSLKTNIDDYVDNYKDKPLGAWYYTSTNTVGSGSGNITGSETEDMAIDTTIKSTGTSTYLYSGKLYAVSGTLKFTNLNSLKHIGLTIKVVIPGSPDTVLHTTQYVETRFDGTDGNYEEATVSVPMNVFCPSSNYTTAPEVHFDIDYGADPYGDNISTDMHAYLTGLG